MSDNNAQRLAKAITLQNALSSDADAVDIEQARADLILAGQNPDEVGEETRSMVVELVARIRKERLVS